MKFIDRAELLQLLSNVRGTTFVSIEAKITPKTKKGCPFNVSKITKASGAIGFNYGNSVNAQLKREGLTADFKPHVRAWGNRIEKTPLVEHKGKHYLELKVQSAASEFFTESGKISVDKLKDYLYTNKASRQHTDNEVIVRDYDLDNITRVKMNGEEYSVIG